jgi:hypothetical protein
MWMLAHDIFMVGSHWIRDSYKPEICERVNCRYTGCGGVEDLQHIFCICKAPGQALVWQLAKELWTKRRPKWPNHSLGAILTCGIAEFRSKEMKRWPGDARLYHIVMSRAAQLIWSLHCKRVISKNNEPPSDETIWSFWKSCINEHLRKDCQAANFAVQPGKMAAPKSCVLATWSGLLTKSIASRATGCAAPGFYLVGIDAG